MRTLFSLFFVTLVALLAFGFALTRYQTYASGRDFPPDGRFVETGSGRIHLVDSGPQDAPPERTLLLLHGASGNHRDMMAAFGARLGGGFRLIAPDRPGHGWSDRGNEGNISGEMASPAAQARMLRAALDKIGVKGAIVVGHSWSGALATNFALDQRDFIKGLVLISPVTHRWPGALDPQYRIAAMPALGDVLIEAVESPFTRLLVDRGLANVFAPQPAPAGFAERIGLWLETRPQNFRYNAEDVRGLKEFVTRQSPRYGEIAVPVTLIAGDSDSVVSTEIHARAFARDVRQTRLLVLPQMGHMPHHNATELVAGEIEALAAKLTEMRAVAN